MAFSSHSAERFCSHRSPRPHPAPAPPAVPNPFTGSSWTRSQSRSLTRHQSGGCACPRDPSASCSRSRSQTRHPSGGRTHPWDPSASCSWSRSRIRRPSGGCTSTRDPSASCFQSHTQAHHLSGSHIHQQDPFASRSQSQSQSVVRLGATPIHGTRPSPILGHGHHRLPTPACGIGLLQFDLRQRVYLVVRGCTRMLGQQRTHSCPLRVPRLPVLIRARSWMLFQQCVRLGGLTVGIFLCPLPFPFFCVNEPSIPFSEPIEGSMVAQ